MSERIDEVVKALEFVELSLNLVKGHLHAQVKANCKFDVVAVLNDALQVVRAIKEQLK